MSIDIPDGSGLTSPQSLAEFTSGSKTGTKHQAIVICDSAGNIVDVATSDPAGTERGVITRNIPSGTQNVLQPDVSTSGTISANGQTVGFALEGQTSVSFKTSGTWVGTLQIEGSLDGTTYDTLRGFNNGGATFNTLTNNQLITVGVAGLMYFRVRATAWTSGAVSILMRASQGASSVFHPLPFPGGSNTLGNIGNTVTSAPAGVRLSDGSAALVGQKVSASSLPVVLASDQTQLDTELPASRTPADSLALVSCPDTGGPNYLYNGSTMDLERNDLEVSLRASAIHNPGAENGPDTTAHNAESLLLIVNVTIVASNGALTVAVQGKDQLSSAYYTYWTAELPIRTTGTYAYFFANGASGGDFTECQAFGLAPRVWRYQTTVTTAAVTYSVACVMGDN